jgi:hypothetical protein
MPDKAVQVRKQLAYRTEKGLRHFVTSGYRRRPSRFRVNGISGDGEQHVTAIVDDQVRALVAQSDRQNVVQL